MRLSFTTHRRIDAASCGFCSRKTLRLFERREIWVPTWRGWLLLLAIVLGLTVGFLAFAYQFLSVNRPVAANILAVDGWIPDYALEEAAQEFKEKGYQYLVAAGGPVPQGDTISGYGNFARVAGTVLLKLRVPKEKLIEAPAAKTYRDRTFESAKAVRAKLNELGISVRGLNVFTEGSHGRRSRMIYRKVFGKETIVGVVTFRPREYEAERWWKSSAGVEEITTGTIEWLFERLFSSGR